MKELMLAFAVVWSLLPVQSAAQRAGGRVGGGVSFHSGPFHSGPRPAMGFSGNYGLPSVGPIPPLTGLRDLNFRRFGRTLPGSGWGYPALYAGYDDPSLAGSPIVVLPEPEGCAPAATPPPPPAKPEIHEYNWPESRSDPSAVFSIVLKDGKVRSAAAVWLQGNTVRYINPDGNIAWVALESINREATRSSNAVKNLTLSIP